MRGKRRPEKFTKNPRLFSMQNSQATTKKKHSQNVSGSDSPECQRAEKLDLSNLGAPRSSVQRSRLSFPATEPPDPRRVSEGVF